MKTLPATNNRHNGVRDRWEIPTVDQIMVAERAAAFTRQQALAYLVMVKETLGNDWLTADLFRFGASSLVNDVLMQIAKTIDGNYRSADYFSLP